MSTNRSLYRFLLLVGVFAAVAPLDALAQDQPTSLSISPSAVTPGQCYTMFVGNGHDMTLDVQYFVSYASGGSGGGIISNWPTLNGSGTASICTDSLTAPGTYTYTGIRNTLSLESDFIAVNASITVNAPAAPNFSISVSPQSRTVSYGLSTTYTVSVTGQNGFSSSVDLSVAGLPPNSSATFGPSSIASGQSSTLTITTSGSTVGAYGSFSVTVTGSGGGSSRSATATLVVNPPAQPTSFSINSAQAYAGNDSYTVTIGNAPNMLVDVQYTFDDGQGGPGETQTGMIATNGSGQWTNTLGHYDPVGTFTFTGIKNHWHSNWVPLNWISFNVLAPKPTSIAINPSTVTAGQDSYTMTVGNGASMFLDLKYTLITQGQTSSEERIDQWPYLDPVASGSSNGQATIPVANCTPPGTYTYTWIKNHVNDNSTARTVSAAVTVNSMPSSISINPASSATGFSGTVAINGRNLCDVGLSTNWPGLTFTDITSNGSSAAATFTVDSSAPTGNASIALTARYGTLTFMFSITNSGYPSVTSVKPQSASPGSTVSVTMLGTNLTGSSISTTWNGVTFSNVSSNAEGTTLTATFHIGGAAALGTPSIQINNSAGSTSTQLFSIASAAVSSKEYIYLGSRLVSIDIGSGIPIPPDQTKPTPSTLSATVISSSEIYLSWTPSSDNVGVTGYRLEQCRALSCSDFSNIATLSSTSYSNGNLAAGAIYRYRVRSVDAAGNLSDYSNVVTAMTMVAQPQSIISISGTPQSATVNMAFTSPLQVKVDDGSSNPLSGIAVTFAAPASGPSALFGSSNSVMVTTNSAGIASSTVPVANNAPGTYTVTASVTGLTPVTFALTNTAAQPSSVVAVSGSPQTTAVLTAFPNALQAKVTDMSSNPLSGVTVTFTAPSSGPSATFAGSNSAALTTNAAGIATAPLLTANNLSGAYNVTASVTGLTAAVFNLSNASSGANTTIFGTSTPVATFNSASSPVELGVKFRSDVRGAVTAIRFYKGSGDTSTHSGSLWTSAGTLLATGSFAGETSNGWQQLNLSTPIAIVPNTTYVASYHTGGSFYHSQSYFQNAGADNVPLHALKDGIDGPNGLYVYGPGGAFPGQTFSASNYWVDVVFAPGSGSGQPQAIVAASGTPQSTTGGTVFGGALQARVTDSSSNPVSGVTVTFTAPSSGAAATFGGATSVSTTTNAAGVATSPIPSANTTVGTYSVTASVTGLPSASFTLTNTPPLTNSTNVTIFGIAAPSATFNVSSSPVELGVKFRADVSGTITAIRFYKGLGDTSTHSGSLWTAAGTLLGTVTFGDETASGWQQMNLATPVVIAANTPYVASYHTGGSFYYSSSYFQNAGADNAPLHALRDGAAGSNGLYVYGSGGMFPSQSFSASNYWVDVVFMPSGGSSGPQSITAFSGTPQSATVGTAFANPLQVRVADATSNPVPGVTVTFTAPPSGASGSFAGSNSATVTTNATGVATSPIFTSNSVSGIYNVTATVTGLTPATFDLTNVASSTGVTVFGTAVPTATFNAASSPVELGMRFRSDVNGTITAIRFYKGSGDTSTHTGSLWSSSGTLLATETFSVESASGWQQLNFSTPVTVTANTTYVASYHSGGPFYYSPSYFQTAGVDSAPLHALKDGVDGPTGVYLYSPGGSFPNQTYSSSNYWVDVVFVSN